MPCMTLTALKVHRGEQRQLARGFRKRCYVNLCTVEIEMMEHKWSINGLFVSPYASGTCCYVLVT